MDLTYCSRHNTCNQKKIIKKEIKSCHKLGRLIGYIVKGICIDLIRRNDKVVYREIFDDEIKVEDTFVITHMFIDAINNLPEKYKVVFIMKILKDMSYSEIAKSLNLKENVIRKRMERAKILMRELWINYDDE